MSRPDYSSFFVYAQMRESVRLRREAGEPPPWTTDPILRQFRFCNVFREDDRTTRWFREHVRDPMRGETAVAEATLIFRWFNRPETGELLLRHDLFRHWDFRKVRKLLTGVSPILGGAYIILTPPGLSKLEGIISLVEQMLEMDVGERIRDQCETLEEAHRLLMDVPFVGSFTAYEIVTDLRHTTLLEHAPDISSWAAAGPGAARGLDRIYGDPLGTRRYDASRTTRKNDEHMLHEMQLILGASRRSNNWPWVERPWEMREVEHTLCEFDKYERARLGEGRLKGRFRIAASRP